MRGRLHVSPQMTSTGLGKKTRLGFLAVCSYISCLDEAELLCWPLRRWIDNLDGISLWIRFPLYFSQPFCCLGMWFVCWPASIIVSFLRFLLDFPLKHVRAKKKNENSQNALYKWDSSKNNRSTDVISEKCTCRKFRKCCFFDGSSLPFSSYSNFRISYDN